MNPTLAGDERYRSWFVRNARAAASPAQARELFQLCAAIDLRPALADVTVPTLLLHREDDPWLSVEHSHYVAGRIPGAPAGRAPRRGPLAVDRRRRGRADGDRGVPDRGAAPPGSTAVGSGGIDPPRTLPAPPHTFPHARQVIALAVQGLSAREIGERLFIGERTAETHIANAYRKLGVASRVELVRRAVELGL
jgi:DNA-binding CsgD family transcriptional regulator